MFLVYEGILPMICLWFCVLHKVVSYRQNKTLHSQMGRTFQTIDWQPTLPPPLPPPLPPRPLLLVLLLVLVLVTKTPLCQNLSLCQKHSYELCFFWRIKRLRIILSLKQKKTHTHKEKQTITENPRCKPRKVQWHQEWTKVVQPYYQLSKRIPLSHATHDGGG